jgi:hypothetical protein
LKHTIWDKRLPSKGIKIRIYEEHTIWKAKGREMGYLKEFIKRKVNKPANNIGQLLDNK